MACNAYSNGSDSPIQFSGTLDSGICFTTPQQMFTDFRDALVATLPGNYAGLVVGDATPAVSDQDKLWYRTSSSCVPYGMFVFYGGKWVRAIPSHFMPGMIVPYYDASFGTTHATNARIITYLDVYDETYSAGVDATNPFWRLCDGTNGTPDLRARIILGAGDGPAATPALSNRIQGTKLGAEAVTLQIGNIPNMSVPTNTVAGTGAAYAAAAASPTGTAAVSSTGNGAHENMPPCNTLYYIMKTARTV